MELYQLRSFAAVEILSPSKDVREAAANLFSWANLTKQQTELTVGTASRATKFTGISTTTTVGSCKITSATKPIF